MESLDGFLIDGKRINLRSSSKSETILQDFIVLRSFQTEIRFVRNNRKNEVF